jgi:hypothetical protein
VQPLSWASISEQLRAIGVEVPIAASLEGRPAPRNDHVPPSRHDLPPPQQPSRADKHALATILAAAKKAGVTFMERVKDGELIVDGLDRLASDDRQKLQANLYDIRNELLREDTSTASLDLLTRLGVELVYVDTEQRAVSEVQRICSSARTLGLDVETAPRPQFLPKACP